MRRILIFLISSLIINSSCKKCDEKRPIVEYISFVENDQKVLNLDLNTSFSGVVKLLTPSNIYIGTIKQVLHCDSGIIVVDKNINLFSRNGDFLRRVSTYGKGPTEYLSIDKVRFRNGNVFILDGLKKCILEYSWNGSPLREYPINAKPNDFEFINDSIVALYLGHYRTFTEGNYSLSFFNLNNGIHEKYGLEYDGNLSYFMNFFDVSNFFRGSNGLYLSHSGCNKVFKIDDDLNHYPKFEFDFGTKTLSQEIVDRSYVDVVDFCEQNRSRGIFFRNYLVADCGNSLVLFTEQSGVNKVGIYNKQTKTAQLYDKISINGADAFELPFSLFLSEVVGGKLVFALYPIELDINRGLQEFIYDNLNIKSSDINSATNPFLVYVDNLKEDKL